MYWVIALIILWLSGCVFYLSVFAAAKRADEMAAAAFDVKSIEQPVMAS
ncbi:hypothetical protein [Paenibacillus pectinilyticus]|nr:hypothetical protein [Paenibacillus pectinilyticus]